MDRSTLLLTEAPNFRDFGGYDTSDGGKVRTGRLYRSELLVGLTTDDQKALARLNIGLICDLRSPFERQRTQNEWPSHLPVTQLTLDIDAEMSAVRPDKWGEKLADPAFDAERARASLTYNYECMPKSFAKDLTELFKYLRADGSGAIVVHCAAGKDRTGFVSAMILHALGVSERQIFSDYLLTAQRYTSERLLAARARILPDTVLDERTEPVLRVLASVQEDFLRAALRKVDTDFGGADAYLADHCGLSEKHRSKLRDALVETA